MESHILGSWIAPTDEFKCWFLEREREREEKFYKKEREDTIKYGFKDGGNL